MRQLKLAKNVYCHLAVSLVILGLVQLAWPQTTLSLICKVVGIVLLICGIIKRKSSAEKENRVWIRNY